MLVIMGVCAFISLILLIWTVKTVVPVTNRFFSLIWEDPQEKERKAVIKRLKELHVDGNVPEEAAVLMASKEFNATEEELMACLGMIKPAELRGLLTGRKTGFGIIASRIDAALRRRVK